MTRRKFLLCSGIIRSRHDVGFSMDVHRSIFNIKFKRFHRNLFYLIYKTSLIHSPMPLQRARYLLILSLIIDFKWQLQILLTLDSIIDH